MIETSFPVLNVNDVIKKLNKGMCLVGKNQEQKKSHLSNQNYVEIRSRFNPGFILLTLLTLFLVTSCYERTLRNLFGRRMMKSPLGCLHIAPVIDIFKKSTGQRYTLLQRTAVFF